MKLHLVLAAATAFVSMSFAAVTADAADPVVAKLQDAVAAKTKVIAGGAVFVCDGAECVASSPASRTIATAACKELAKSVGPVAAFGDSRKQLADDKLAACNTVAVSGAMVANR